MSEPFIAEIRMMPYSFAPRDWAWCEGQLLPIAQNPALYSIIGTYYGGDGRVSMGLPDLRGRAVVGAGQSPGFINYPLGIMGGQSAVPLGLAQMPTHTHNVTADGEVGPFNSPAGNLPAQATQQGRTGSKPLAAYHQLAGSAANPDMVGMTGKSVPHENMQPYTGVNFCIALQGLFPSRN